MMAEYINRQAFLDHMKGTSRYFAVKFDIESFPVADVAPVVHGRWIHDGRRIESGIDWCHCSECGKSDNFCARTNYCHNCGAKMDGGAK